MLSRWSHYIGLSSPYNGVGRCRIRHGAAISPHVLRPSILIDHSFFWETESVVPRSSDRSCVE
jgi:hypothetical protein